MTEADEEFMGDISTRAFELLAKADNDPLKIDDPYKTVAIIYAAQGIIDNGGLAYFFENDFPGNPPYEVFVEAYEKIGIFEGADSIRTAVASFPFDFPECEVDKRRAFIKTSYNPDLDQVADWKDNLCGDEEVWEGLLEWSLDNVEFEE